MRSRDGLEKMLTLGQKYACVIDRSFFILGKTPAPFQVRQLARMKEGSSRRAQTLFDSLLSSVFCLSRYREDDVTVTLACLLALFPLLDLTLTPSTTGVFLRLGHLGVVAISQDRDYLEEERKRLVEMLDSVCPALVSSLGVVFSECLQCTKLNTPCLA